MIDDDFDKLVKDMFERFFGGAFKMMPGENRTHIRIEPDEVASSADLAEREMIVDEIDLGDEYLVIVESPVEVVQPVAMVRGSTLEIKVNPVESRGIEIEVPFIIDIELSTVSHNNGVIEARLVKNTSTGAEANEGILRII